MSAFWDCEKASTFRVRTNFKAAEGVTHRGQIFSKCALLKGVRATYVAGKNEGEEVPLAEDGRMLLKAGQTARILLGHIKPSGDVFTGVPAELLGVANVGHPGILPRGYEGELFVTVQAVKEIDLLAAPYHLSVSVAI